MYKSFFGFTYTPFAGQPDRRGVFWSNGHRNALSVIELGLTRLAQVTVLTGEAGTGKTMLVRHLVQSAGYGFDLGMLSGCAGARRDLLQDVLAAFGSDASPASDIEMKRRLARLCAGQLAQGRRSVLVIDDAHTLSSGDLETLRRLGDLNVTDAILLLVLVGRPQLRAALARSENSRIRQRIGADYRLEPMTADETGRYVRQMISQAGVSEEVFEAAALDEIHRQSGGVPLQIDRICDQALAAACAERVRQVSRDMLRAVAAKACLHGIDRSPAKRENEVASREETEDEAEAEAAPLARPAPTPARRRTLLLAGSRPISGRRLAGDPEPPPRNGGPGSGFAHPDVPPEIFGFASWSDDIWDFIENPDGPHVEAVARPALMIPPPIGASARGGPSSTAATPAAGGGSPGDGMPERGSPKVDPRTKPGAAGATAERSGAARAVPPADQGAAQTSPRGDASPAETCAGPLPVNAANWHRTASARDTAATGAGGGEADLRRVFAPSGGRRGRWRSAATLGVGSVAAVITVAMMLGHGRESAAPPELALRTTGAMAGPQLVGEAASAPGPEALNPSPAAPRIDPSLHLSPDTAVAAAQSSPRAAGRGGERFGAAGR